MPEPIVASVVIDGVERWGASDARWVRVAQQTPAPAVAEPEEETGDAAPADAAPSDDPKPKPSKR